MIGQTIGSYQILGKLGEGGMGEVYRARDSKLKREVAIKVLPADVAGDRERLARFQREAEVLASLNHPHIAQVFGLEDGALIMELVEGEDLSTLIASGTGSREPGTGLPIDEALSIAKQIAEALEAAHEAGIVHRDLKPANVKVRPDSTVKVLDFGLAKEMESGTGTREPGADLANSPTITSPAMTMRGVILGTAAYMSPEQAKGKVVDKRADIWAFGCVLYEMLTGTRAFKGDDVTDIITSVMRDQPDWAALPPGTPAAIRTLLRRCLEKDPHKRAPHMAIARLALEDAATPTGELVQAAAPRASSGRLLAGATLLLATGLAGGFYANRVLLTPPATTEPLVSRFDITPPAESAVVLSGNTRDVAISRDGRRIAYVGGNGAALFVRDLDRPEPVRVVSDGFPSHPFFSPDGKWVGFTDGIDALKRVPAGGGRVETITRILGPGLFATPGFDGTIVYSMGGSLWRTPFAGGTPAVAATPDQKRGEGFVFGNPSFLPSQAAVLFSMIATPPSNGRVGVLDLATGARKVILDDANEAQYVDSGHLVYRSGRTMRAVAFDLVKRDVVGAPVNLVEPILITSFGNRPQIDVASNGTMIFVPADAPVAARRLIWVERDGRERSIALPIRSYTYVAISPDGTQAALDIRDQENDIWIWRLAGDTLRRLTFGRLFEQTPRWTRDGQRVLFTLGPTISQQRVDGTGGVATAFAHRSGGTLLNSIAPDGKQVLFRSTATIESGQDVMVGDLDNRHTARSFVATRANELNAEISPDGRWVAYESDESGTYEIYVRPFPDAGGGRWQVSNGGGRKPLWNRDGRELFFVSGNGAMMAAAVESAATFSARAPVELFRGNYYFGSASSLGRTFDVSPDGRRFLMIKDDQSRPTSLAVVLNWTEELKRLAPVGAGK